MGHWKYTHVEQTVVIKVVDLRVGNMIECEAHAPAEHGEHKTVNLMRMTTTPIKNGADMFGSHVMRTMVWQVGTWFEGEEEEIADEAQV